MPSVFLFQALTLGIYFLYWCWRSKNEVNQAIGKQLVPSIWWFALPFGGFWWAWQYALAVENVTKGKVKYGDSFGYFVLATLGVIAALWFPLPDLDPPGETTSVALIVWGIVYLALIILALGIFPAAMQSRFNKLLKK